MIQGHDKEALRDEVCLLLRSACKTIDEAWVKEKLQGDGSQHELDLLKQARKMLEGLWSMYYPQSFECEMDDLERRGEWPPKDRQL